MATENKRIQRIIAGVSTINNGQICIEDTADGDIGGKRLAWKDTDGTEHKALGKDENARIADLNVTGSISGTAFNDFLSKSTDDSDDVTEGATNLYMTSAEKSKLAGIEAGAEVNDVDSVFGRTGAVVATSGDYTAAQVTNAFDKTADDASDVPVEPLTGGTGTGTTQQYMDYASGFMLIDWDGVTDNGDGTIDIAEGLVWASRVSDPGSPKDFFTIPARPNVALDDNGGLGASNYICADVSGTPQWVVTLNVTPYLPPNESGRFVDSVFIESDGEVHTTNLENLQVSHHSTFQLRDFDFAAGKGGSGKVLHARGAIMGTTGTRHMSISEGRFWNGYQRVMTNEFDTNVSGTVRRYYTTDSGTSWVKGTVTQLSNTQYNDITSGLVSMNTGRFKVCWMFLDSQGDVYVELEGQNQYTSLALAEEEDFPTVVPLFISAYCEPVGRYIVQQGSDTIITQSAFTADLQLGATNDHNFLSNRNGDSAYLHYGSQPSSIDSVVMSATDNMITGSNSLFRVATRELENIDSYESPYNISYLAVNDIYVVISIGNGDCYVYDRATLTEINSSTSTVRGPVEFVDDHTVAIMSSADLDYYKLPSLEPIQNTTITTTALCDVGLGKTSGKIYTARGTSTLYRHNLDGTDDTNTGALPSATGVICAFTLSEDENTLYVLDAPHGSAGAAWFRIYDVTTFESPTLTGSLQLTSTTPGELYAKICMHKGYVAVTYTKGNAAQTAALTDLVDISTPATPTLAFAGQDAVGFRNGRYCVDGTIWGARNLSIQVDALPTLTIDVNGFLNLFESGLRISDGTRAADAGQILNAVEKADNPYEQTDREVAASTTVELYDRGNTVFVDGLSANAEIDIDSAVLAIDGFEFAIMVDYDATYNVDLVYTAATNWWRCPGSSSSSGPLCYKFVIKNSKPIPCGLMPTWV